MIFEDDVEIVELSVAPDSKAAGVLLLNSLIFQKACSLVSLQDQGLLSLKGDTVFSGGDVVAFIVRKDAIDTYRKGIWRRKWSHRSLIRALAALLSIVSAFMALCMIIEYCNR